jgi:cell division protein FtsB
MNNPRRTAHTTPQPAITGDALQRSGERSTPLSLGDQKTSYEIEKLKEDIRLARKSPWFSPTTLLSAIIAFVAVGGYFIQHSLQNFDLRQAQIDKTTAEDEQIKAENQLTTLNAKNGALQLQVDHKSAELTNLNQQLEEAKKRFAATQITIGKTAASGQSVAISGTVSELTGQMIPNVQIKVFDLATGKVIATARSNSQGQFAFSTPATRAISITFSDDIHQSRVLDGIAGDSDLTLRISM